MIPTKESAGASPVPPGLEVWLRQLFRDEIARAIVEVLPPLRSIDARLARIESVAGPTATPEYVSVTRAARMADVSSRTIHRWVKQGLPAHGPRHDRIDPRELDAFMRARTRGHELDAKTDDDHAREIMERGMSGNGG